MLVNAHQFPGPALWQGIMLCLIPLLVFGLCYKDGKYFNLMLGIYAAIGICLLLAILLL